MFTLIFTCYSKPEKLISTRKLQKHIFLVKQARNYTSIRFITSMVAHRSHPNLYYQYSLIYF